MWERLEQEAKEPGNWLQEREVSKENVEDCRDECDKTQNCKSFVYCERLKLCYLYDGGYFDENTLQKDNEDCFTTYHSCSGNFSIVIQMIAILYEIINM